MTVCLHSDFILDKEVRMGRDPVKGGQNCSKEPVAKAFATEKHQTILETKAKLY